MPSQQSSPLNSFLRLHGQNRFGLRPRQPRTFERSSTPMIAQPFCRRDLTINPLAEASSSTRLPVQSQPEVHRAIPAAWRCCVLCPVASDDPGAAPSSSRRSTKSGPKKPSCARAWVQSVTDMPNWSPGGSAFVEEHRPDTLSVFTRPCHWLKHRLGTHVAAQAMYS